MQSPVMGFAYRNIAKAVGVTRDDPEILARAKAEVAKMPPIPFPYTSSVLGYMVQWLSEPGKREELQGLLQDADERMRPTWENGGLFYPLYDTRTDDVGDWTYMNPFTGNAAIDYARLNVEDGQKLIWEKPWTREFLASQLWVDVVDLASGVDCLRSIWHCESRALVVTLATWDNSLVQVQPVARNLAAGRWVVYVKGELVESKEVEADGDVMVNVEVKGEEQDIVFLKAK
ncbi:hypothetical protein NW765_017671 [Fusarium oxysporum]|nr:hypothetical protein NW765_017671 [Fusarium oxysporum]